MRVEDLMLGDWVQGFVPDSNSTIYGLFNKQRVAIIAEPIKAYIELSIDDIQPIPLTPEILEKNGFRETDVVVVGTRKMRWESEDTRTEITIWMDYTMPMEIRKNIYYEDEVCYILPFAWAVHELQHALRLCGIEKDIVL